jgi:sporulation protein YhbH
MSIFRSHKATADRSASDRARHKQKIDKAIRDGVTDIVADESIIGQDGKKKIKIPVKGIKEWQFVYGDNEGQKQVGSAPGQDVQKGQVVKKGQQQGQGSGNRAGKDKGEEFYEVEITLDELAEYLFASLNLPDLDRKRFKKLLDEKPRKHGTRTKGIRPRLDKKKSAIQRIKRLSAAKRNAEEDEEISTSFHEDDLRYYHIDSKPKESTNAVVFFAMDVSGSMTQEIRFLARSFFFLLYQFLRHKYEKTEVVFISHTTEAEETDEDNFFRKYSSGGTHVSSAPTLAQEIIMKRFHPSSWNVYYFHCTDGDNWSEDNEAAVKSLLDLSGICQLLGYVEIIPPKSRPDWDTGAGSLYSKVKEIEGPSLKTAVIESKDSIWPVFKNFFGGLPDV